MFGGREASGEAGGENERASGRQRVDEGGERTQLDIEKYGLSPQSPGDDSHQGDTGSRLGLVSANLILPDPIEQRPDVGFGFGVLPRSTHEGGVPNPRSTTSYGVVTLTRTHACTHARTHTHTHTRPPREFLRGLDRPITTNKLQ